MSNFYFLILAAGCTAAANAQWINHTTESEVYDTVRTATLNEITLTASRPGARVPMPQLRLKPADLAKQNGGRDIPFLLQGLPSFTASSDAGNGFGYSYLRFRGMDQTRINVTVNNVGLNDPESHGVFWVNTPERQLAGSAAGRGHVDHGQWSLWGLSVV